MCAAARGQAVRLVSVGRRRALLALLALTLAGASSRARADQVRVESAIDDGDARAVLSLLTSVETATRGETFDVGVRFALDDGWHVYFRNPGEAALGTELTFRAEGARVGEVAWPVPERLLDPSGTIATFGYEEDVLFVAPVAVARDAGETIVVSVVADFLVCKIECVPGRVSLARTLRVADVEHPADEETRDRIDATRAALPRAPSDAGANVVISLTPSAIAPRSRARATVTITCADGSRCGPLRLAGVRAEAVFFPDRVQGLTIRPVALRAEGAHAATLELELEASADDPGADQRLSGIVALPTERGRLALEIDGPIPRARAAAQRTDASTDAVTPGATDSDMPLWLVLLFAFLGGLVLNVMPCVLPVLALKVFAVAQGVGESRAQRTRHVLAYVVGVVGSFLGLAIAVVALRAAGTSVGWGMQLQEPRFVAALAAVVVVFALGLFGVYSLGVSATTLAGAVDRRTGPARAFGEGVLAVVLATPCSAPFLGSAVGFALTQPSAIVIAVFVVVGLGLSAPFVLLALVPRTARMLPRPGAWMHVVEQALGFVLLGTAAWLVWIVGTLAGVDGMARALGLALVAAFVTWGAASVRDLPTMRRRVARLALLVVLVTSGLALVRDLAVGADAAPRTAGHGAWSEEAVRAHLEDGAIVFVDFTASWCITCKANERVVLAADDVRRRFDDAGVVTLVGDYTQRDPRIAAVLERHRKAGVPLYLVYSPARPASPEVLPELLTEGIVLDAIARAEGGSR